MLRVVMKELIFSLATSTPFTNPARVAASTAAARFRPPPSPSSRMATVVAKTMFEPTDRSKSAPIIRKVMPMPMMLVMLTWNRMLKRFSVETNIGRTKASTATMPRMMSRIFCSRSAARTLPLFTRPPCGCGCRCTPPPR